MAGANDNELTITLPAALVPTRGTDTLSLKIATDAKGKRALARSFQDANSSAPGRRRSASWEIWGGIGRSLESTAGGLGIDFLQNLEGRWERQLRSSIAQTAVSLTSHDPPGILGSYFGSAIFGSSYFGSPLGGGSSGLGPDATVFAEQQGYLLVGRGRLLTQVDLATWTVIETLVLDAPVLDMDTWLGHTYVAQGAGVPLQRVVSAAASGMVLEDVIAISPAGAVYASDVKVGSDRAWYLDADESSASYHYASFTLDGFETLAAPFPVGDAMVGVDGIGPYGSLTAFGLENTISTSTDQGKATKLSRALETVQGARNGAQFADPGFGWNYYLSETALRAHTFAGVDNPVGVGERMRGFTGHNGLATAVYSARGELWVVYQTLAGNLYGYRGQFGPEAGGSGQPLLFPWFYAAAETCLALFSSTTPNVGTQYMTMIRASGTNLKYMTIARNGMDNLYAVSYSTAGGVGYLTTLDRNPNLRKTLRLARVRAARMAGGDAWAVAFAFDADPDNPTAATYVAIGSATANGETTLYPLTGAADAQGNPTPTLAISGATIKPRVTETVATTDAQLLGTLDIEYDERPEQVEVFDASVEINMNGQTQTRTWDLLRELAGATVDGPYKVQLPDDLAPAVAGASGGGQRYAMLEIVAARNDLSAQTQHVDLRLSCWPAADVLSNT